MKKINKFLGIFSFVALIFTSCEVGLGPAVDMQPPVVTLTSHKDNDSVASKFRLSGTASDNEGVTKLSIDFDDKNIHFYTTNEGIWYKKTASSDWTAIDQSVASVKKDGNTMNWSVEVDTSDSTVSGNTYSFSIIAEDELGNSGKESKVTCSLFIDENLPQASIIKPELISVYNTAKSRNDSYTLKNANVIKYLKNGDITVTGRLDGAISSKELLIQFDNGITSPFTSGYGDSSITAGKVAKDNTFDASKVYLSKSLKVGENGISELRAWELVVKQSEWVTDSLNSELKSGKHLIRVVATSISSAYAYERKVIGWFTWYPESDEPWITMNGAGTELEPVDTYPSANLTGEAYDDDGIKSLTYKIEKLENGSYKNPSEGTLNLSEANATSTSWALKAPSDEGNYKLTVTIKDLYNKQSSVESYHKVMDIQPPSINIKSPNNQGFIIDDAIAKSNGDIIFTGEITDDGLIDSFDIIYLHPVANSDPSNIVRYMSGEEDFWDWQASEASLASKESETLTYTYKDAEGKDVEKRYKNKKFRVTLSGPTPVTDENGKNNNKYTFTKTLNLFSDLGITGDGSKPLVDQYFVFRAKDSGGTSTVEELCLRGDNKLPVVTLSTVQVNNGSPLNYSDITSLAPVNANTDKITLSGTWSDNSSDLFGKNRINTIVVNYSDISKVYPVTMTTSGWTAVLSEPAPSKSGVITITLKDYAGNEKKLEKSLMIETETAGLARVSCEQDDGVYSKKKNSVLKLAIEFNKSTDVNFDEGKEPELILSSGGKAKYKKYTSDKDGSGTTKHYYEYTVGKNDTDGKLLVTGIETNGATWSDSKSHEPVTVSKTVLEKAINLSSRNIVIDNTQPAIKKILIMNDNKKPFKAGDTIVLMMELSENVTISNVGNLKLVFKGETSNPVKTVTTTKATASGTNYVMFEYTVASGQNFNELKFDKITAETTDVTFTDEAKNVYTVKKDTPQTLPETITANKKIEIDTNAPAIPKISTSAKWPSAVVLDELTDSNKNDIYFTISGTETGATVKYTLDGSNYLTYTAGSTIYLRNNGTYTINAYQIDKAGNESEKGVASNNTNSYSVTIDRGPLLKRISATTDSGTYKAGTTIEGIIEFRKPVIIPSGENAKVTLNIKNGKDVAIIGAGTESSSYSFEYQIDEGDSIANNGNLDVTLKFDSVTLGGKSVSIATPAESAEGRFKNQRQIKILTGKPVKKTVSFTGEGKDAVLTVSYDNDREITKVTSYTEVSEETGEEVEKNYEIKFAMKTDDFKIPVVLSASEYAELVADIPDLENYYKEDVNGANKKNDGTLENYTTKKYVLDYQYDDNNVTIKNLFTDDHKHEVSIPMYSSSVQIKKDSSNKKTILEVKLGSLYKLPVKGAEYTLTIPKGAIEDIVGNQSDAISEKVTAEGLEEPVIRINKVKQTISSSGVTSSSTVKMPETAAMKINCRTPGAKINYEISGGVTNNVASGSESTAVHVNESPKYFTTKTSNPVAPTISATSPEYSTPITLGSGNNTTNTLNYSTAKGLKFAITAQSSKGSLTKTSWEYAARTVLKFIISGKYDEKTGSNGDTVTGITEGGKTLTFKDLKVWVIGGQYPSGGNSLNSFPLSWGDPSNFKLMAGEHYKTYTDNEGNVQNYETKNMNGEWWWITWDVSAATYHGFAIGNVPSDASTNTTGGPKGPKEWYVSECGWVAQKENYVLWPGETLEMAIEEAGSYHATFMFREKNKGER